MDDPGEITHILARLGTAPEAAERLLPHVYRELRALAGRHFVGQPKDHTLQPTALVHEAYLRIAGSGAATFSDRAHFFAVAATAMRQILVNHAAARGAAKRGGPRGRVSLEAAEEAPSPALDVDAAALHEALERLAALDQRQARIVEMRYFCAMTVPEVAHVLDVSTSTVEKDWRMAKLWLLRALDAPAPE